VSSFSVLVSDAIAGNGVAKLKAAGFFVDVKPGLKPEAIATIIGHYDAWIVRSATKATKELIGKGTRLKVIARAGVGLDNVDVAAAQARGIQILNTPGATAISVAEHALGLMLALYRHIPDADRRMRAGQWEKKRFEGRELSGKTLGLVGLGRIGQELARRAIALGMKVLANRSRVTKAADDLSSLGIRVLPLEHLLPVSDVVSLHCPLNDTTRNLINAATLNLMKQGAILVHCARGGVVDEGALGKALQSGRLAGAALDVFPEEPVKGTHPLAAFENVILTPHLGASTAEGQDRSGEEVADLVIAALGHR
jgi:D-3-phosphoglycerate dehydrogenase